MKQKTFSGVSGILPALDDGNSYVYNEGGGGIQFITIIDDKFNIPEEFQNKYVHDLNIKLPKLMSLIIFHEGKYRLLARNLELDKLKELRRAYVDKLIPGIEIRMIDDSQVDKLVENYPSLTPYEVTLLFKERKVPPLYDSEDIMNLTKLDPEFIKSTKKIVTFSGMAEVAPLYDHITVRKGMDFNGTTIDSEGFDIPKEVKDELNIKTTNNSSNMKTYSVDPKSIKPTDRDIWEFNAWIKGKGIKPRLRAKFDSDSQYEDFMITWQDEHLDIHNDPAVIGNTPKKHATREQGRRLSDITINWKDGNPFYLEKTPFLKSPIKGDAVDGIHIGQLTAHVFSAGDIRFELEVGVRQTQPIECIAVIRNKTAYLFKPTELPLTPSVASFGECPESGCIYQNKDGDWKIISNKTGKDWPQNYKSKDNAEAALDAYHANKGFADNGTVVTKAFKGFGFNDIIDDGNYEINYGTLIGTLTSSHSYAHLFHYISFHEYPAHMALEDYYESIGDLTDSLAEHILAFAEVEEFKNVVFPKTCPIDYMKRLLGFCIKAKDALFDADSKSGYQSQMDDITNEISECLYRLIRLSNGHKHFSIARKQFSTADDILSKMKAGDVYKKGTPTYNALSSLNIPDGVKFNQKVIDKGLYIDASDYDNKLVVKELAKKYSFGDNHGTVIVKTSNPKQLGALLEHIKWAGNGGHTFDIVVDPDNSDYKAVFDWDGDGSDSISDIQIEDIVRNSNVRHFSMINSDEDFRKYAHTVMKEAHGDNYSEEVTDKVVDDLLKSEHEDYGELIGRLTSSFGK